MEKELIEKARAAKTPEELMTLAKENGTELTEAEAASYFAQLHPKTGELSDEELDNVAGGGCYAYDGALLTTIGYRCKYWGNDPGAISASLWTDVLEVIMTAAEAAVPRTCYHPANRKKS